MSMTVKRTKDGPLLVCWDQATESFQVQLPPGVKAEYIPQCYDGGNDNKPIPGLSGVAISNSKESK